jgi:hypothetical protein
MLQETSGRNDGPAPCLEAKGAGSVNSVSPSAQKIVVIGSPFVRTGSIRLDNTALRIDYQSFGKEHSAIIGMIDLQRLTRDRFAPAAPVKQIRQGVDDTEVTEKIGYASRTVSGKALKISTTTSGGDMVVSWNNFLQVVNGKVRSAPISRIKKSAIEVPGPSSPAHGRNIREGLVEGF